MKQEQRPLREWLELSGMTQQQLAVAAGLHISSIGGVLSGRQSPNLKTMRAIAKGLGVAYERIIWPERIEKPAKPKQSKTLAPVA